MIDAAINCSTSKCKVPTAENPLEIIHILMMKHKSDFQSSHAPQANFVMYLLFYLLFTNSISWYQLKNRGIFFKFGTSTFLKHAYKVTVKIVLTQFRSSKCHIFGVFHAFVFFYNSNFNRI